MDRGARSVVKEFWSSFLLPFLGLIVSMNLLTTFTHRSSMDALLVILVFSVWYGTHQIDARLKTIERYLAGIVLQHVPDATRRDVLRDGDGIPDGETNGTVLTTNDKPILVESRRPWRGAR